ncbi:MAG: D-glycero-beta-D-manno-heptose-7-phosphate kinase [Bacteroidetes bacterium]|jgi:rfaE bifunctional protein kinase chain/domain|nr:D-glycero-beta-D-manno-heptose-7-phosphate kinase [Bacteroidota bacterium]
MINKEEVKQLIKRFSSKKIMVIGDVMVDAYLWGKVDRISPEAPVPVISCSSRENRLGGAANVALNIQSLGATPVLCAVIGDDDKGKAYMELMDKRKLLTDGILVDKSRPTTSKTRIISNHQQLLRVDQEITDYLGKEIENQYLETFNQLMHEHDFDAIVFQDYDKGCITPEVIKTVVDTANKKGIPTLVDPKKRNFLRYKGVTLFKPNYKELVEGLKVDIKKGDTNEMDRLTKSFLSNHNFKYLLVTLSELGVFIRDGLSACQIPAEIRDIADVSGAGDTVISVASLCLAAQLDMQKTAWLSNLAGGLVCEKVGVVPIQTDWILEECENK